MKRSTFSEILLPAVAGTLAGLAIFALSFYARSLSCCALVFIVIAILMAVINPLNSGPAFGGWIKASTTAIDGMNSEIRSRRKESITDKMGALLFLTMSLLTYLLLGFALK